MIFSYLLKYSLISLLRVRVESKEFKSATFVQNQGDIVDLWKEVMVVRLSCL